MKTFYNANALQNHKNTQHDGEVADREWETGSRPAFQKAQANVICSYILKKKLFKIRFNFF